MEKDTIAAIASGVGNAGIGVIRISGNDAIKIADKIFVAKNKKKITESESHTIHYGHIKNDDVIIDEVIVLLMRAPNSYTKENIVEIDCHGGTLITRKVLDVIVANGARPAEPGEFTKRAFLNGRIDLSQAEAVMDIIQSQNEFALRTSINQLSGSIQKKIRALREQIIYEIAFIESALDDPEHISLDGYPEKLNNKLEYLLKDMKHFIDTADDGKMLKEGIRTVIIGKPNAGKSSLLNVLVGEERAIVTEVAGTTRDILEEPIYIQGIQLNIIDTAGIRKTDDIVEKIGVERAEKYADEADLIIYVVDSTTTLDENDENIIQMLSEKKVIVLLNKSDLEPVITKEMLREKIDKTIIPFSAKEEKGLQQLQDEIKQMFFRGDIKLNDEVYITNVRHKNELGEAYNSLELVRKSIEDDMPEDFYSIDLMNAYQSLGNIIGEAVEDDLVNEIFYKFCTGK